MIIEKVEDGKEFPSCPDCDVPLYQESMELGNKQKAEKKRWVSTRQLEIGIVTGMANV